MRDSCTVVEESVWRESRELWGIFLLRISLVFLRISRWRAKTARIFSRPLSRFRTRWDVQTALGVRDRETNRHHNRETGETETDYKAEREKTEL